MNENSKKGAIGEAKSIIKGGLIQLLTQGAYQIIRKNNTNTKDDGIDTIGEIDKDEFKEKYKDCIKSLKKEGGKK